ncbi:MAG: OmpA family protein [Desulforhopalus sp.]
MKRTVYSVLCAAVALALSMPALAIEMSPDAQDVPKDYAVVTDGKVIYKGPPTAWSSQNFNAILEAYGLAIAPEAVADVPTDYAKTADDKVIFNGVPTAYTPADYNRIFNAYGVTMSTAGCESLKGYVDYCKVVDDKVVFPDSPPTAYGSIELSRILGAYELPMVAVVETECIDSDGDLVCDEVDVCGNTPKGVKVDERGCWVLEQSYLFDFDKAVVKEEFYPLLDEIAEIMKANPEMKVRLEGNTDSIGTNEYNQGLSERRANAVKASLMERNMIDGAKLETIGYGEEKPIATNETAEGRALNRRVDLTPIW